jgi:hypothetical protein
MHPGTYSDPFTDGGAINQYDFTVRDSFYAQHQLKGFGQYLDSVPGAVPSISTNYAAGSPAQCAALVAYLNVWTTAPASLLNMDLGSAVLEPTTTATRTRDWKTVGFWAGLRAAAPLAVDDGWNHLRISRPVPFGVRHFEMGNESDYDFVPCHRHRMPGEFSVDKGNGNYKADARNYARFYKASRDLMLQVDPTIKVGASLGYWEASDVWSSHTVPLATNPSVQTAAWPPVMLTEMVNLGVVPDYVIAHRYTTQPDMEWNTNFVRQTLVDYLGAGPGATPEIHVTEFNWGSGFPNETFSNSTGLNNGLLLAQVYGESMQANVDRVDWFCLASNANSFLPTNDPWRKYHDWGIVATGEGLHGPTAGYPGYFTGAWYPTAHGYKIARQFAAPGDQIYKPSALTPANTNSGTLWAFASRRPDSTHGLLFVNKATTTQTVEVQFSTLAPTLAAGWTWGRNEDELQRAYAFATPPVEQVVSAVPLSASISGNAITTLLPPVSVNVLRLNDPTIVPVTLNLFQLE